MNLDADELLAAFEARALDNRRFGHAEHLAVAWAMLRRDDFTDAVARYGAGIRALAAAAGAPEKYNATITVAFLSLIAERMQSGGHDSFAAFADANPDLLTKDAVSRLYSGARLASPAARTGFLLPDRPLRTASRSP
ncbi:hypothetical protein [Minwuia thermotolerans]|uniref:Uncharacterized protein n=1 Tax=Minwuia thermotolerans TaxID=2056226 RepID=A0A2M9G4D3_9PROT|nr:hypothetical protein [Minwuia thermotolerans]PJK30571.1 hypothetical protein CVT23_06405 [Minwuia thermotolerans]